MNADSNEEAVYIEGLMKRFKLVDIRNEYQGLVREATESNMSHLEFLKRLLEIEAEGKNNRKQERLRNSAGFETMKKLEDIDYSFNPSLDYNKITELGKLGFIDAHENVIIIGPPGVGKSMIATGIGLNACNAGYKVLFINAKDLVDQMYERMQEGYLREALTKLQKVACFFRSSVNDTKKAPS